MITRRLRSNRWPHDPPTGRTGEAREVMQQMSSGQLAFLRYLNDQHLARIDIGCVDGSLRFVPSLIKRGYVERIDHVLLVTEAGKKALFQERAR